MSKTKNWFEDFPPTTSDEWKAKIKTDLKGADYNDKVVWQTGLGFDVQPFYTDEDTNGDAPYSFNKPNNNWEIRQDFIATDFEATNKTILNALNNGVNALGLVFDEVISQAEFNRLLQNVNPEFISLHIEANEKAEEVFNLLLEWIVDNSFSGEKLQGSFNIDPLCDTNTPDWAYYKSLVEQINNTLPNFNCITIHAEPFHIEGANIVQELAFTLSKAHEYLYQLQRQGLTAEDLVKTIQFSVPISPDYFMEIAKLRALRLLWPTVAKQYTEMEISTYIQAGKSWKENSNNPYNNMLSHTTEAMSAAIGGADVIHLSEIEQEKGDLFQRVARNVNHVLKYEAHIDNVSDPAAGSYYIETLTEKIAQGAWALFQKTEKEGGYSAINWKAWIAKKEVAQ